MGSAGGPAGRGALASAPVWLTASLSLSVKAPVLGDAGEMAQLLQLPGSAAGEGRSGRPGAETGCGATAGGSIVRIIQSPAGLETNTTLLCRQRY